VPRPASCGNTKVSGATSTPPGTDRRLIARRCLCVMAVELGKWLNSAWGQRVWAPVGKESPRSRACRHRYRFLIYN